MALRELSTTSPLSGTVGISALFARCGGDDPSPSDTWIQQVAAAARGERRQIGRYLVGERLGAGGFGVVYAAFDPLLDREVAIKLVRRRRAGDHAALDLRSEAQALASVQHPNVVPVFDVGCCGERAFIVMQRMHGATLATWLAEGRARERVLAVMMAAGRGLAAAHAAGLIHCDFKPGNVIVGTDDQPAILDFGLARWAAQDDTGDDLDTDDDDRRDADTPAGMGGTPQYMAPEQHRGEPVDARTDVYAYALTLLEALLGTRALAGSSSAALYRAKMAQSWIDPHAVPGLAPEIADAIVRGLSPHPRDRFRDLAAMLRAMQRPRGRWRGRSAAVVMGLGAVLVLGGGPRADASSCDGVGAAADGHHRDWSHHRDALAAELAAAEVVAPVRATLTTLADRHAEGWRAAAAGVCDVPTPRRAAVARCLAADFADFTAVLRALPQQGGDEALAAVSDLADPAHCATQASPRGATRSDDVLAHLHAATVHTLTLEFDALEHDLAWLDENADGDDLELQARVALWRHGSARHRGDWASGRRDLEAAFALARGVRADALAHRVALDLAEETALLHGDLDGAADWLRTADAVLGDPVDPMARARRRAADARIAVRAFDPATTIAQAQLALAELERAGLETSALSLRMQVLAAEARLVAGELTGFEAWAKGFIALAGTAAGPRSRAVADGHRLLGQYYVNLDRAREATAELVVARELLEVHGERLLLAQVHNSLAHVAALEGDIDRAVASYREAIAATPADGEADRGATLLNLANAELAAGRSDDGERDLLAAEVVFARVYDRDHASWAYVADAHAELAALRGRWHDAATHAREAAGRFETAFGDGNWLAADSWLAAAEAELARGRFAAAADALRHADGVRDAAATLLVRRDLIRADVALAGARGQPALARASLLAAQIRLAALHDAEHDELSRHCATKLAALDDRSPRRRVGVPARSADPRAHSQAAAG